MKMVSLDDDDDDDDDSDFDYQAGDAVLYDSCFDKVDEIAFLRDFLITVSNQNPQYNSRLMSLINTNPEKKSAFEQILMSIDELKAKEDDMTK